MSNYARDIIYYVIVVDKDATHVARVFLDVEAMPKPKQQTICFREFITR